MKCSKCNFENPTEAKFCMECGTKLENVCPKCGTKVPDEAKFCMECGAKVSVERVASSLEVERTVSSLKEDSKEVPKAAPPKLEDMHTRLQSVIPQSLVEKYSVAMEADSRENRPVTTLFADISGFTPLSTTLSSEAVFQLVEECFNDLVNIIAGYEGKISGFRGDGLLALFGAPILHENDAERAILAALDMRNAMAQKQLQVSVGINTATMTVGEIKTSLHSEYTAHSMEVNRAARFQEIARPDQILVGVGTYRLTRRAFDFQRIEGLSLRGIGEGMVAYEALRVKERPEKLRGIEGLRARMIGREKEFADLKEATDGLLAGEGQMVSIIGEAGIGKSRLVLELKEYLKSKRPKECNNQRSVLLQEEREIQRNVLLHHSPPWLEGRCVSIGHTISYWPILDILHSYFGLSEGDGEKDVARKVVENITRLFPQRADDILPFFGHLMSIRFGDELDGKLQYFSPEQIMHQTLMRLRDFFVTLARESPLLLILDDLHWADALSLELIRRLMDELVTTPLMLLCVYRPRQDTEIETLLRQLPSIAQRKCLDRYTEINLKQLSARESRQLVETLLTIDNLPESVKEMILRRTEGNPFFIEEVIRSLIDRDLIYREGERWKARQEIVELDVPNTIQNVILARVDRLKAEAKYVLQCASVIGRLFKYRLLEHLARQERNLDQYLSEFEERDLVYEERTIPELEYAFKHALTQETTYQGIIERRRQEFHHQVAQGIEMLYHKRIEEYYEELAHHYAKSKDKPKALEYLQKAGQKCFDACAMKDAIRYYTDAIEVANQISVDKEMLAELYQQRGEARNAIGEYEEQIEDYKEALKYTERKDYRAMLYGQIAWAYRWFRSDRKNAIKYANLGHTELEGAAESKWTVAAYAAVGTILTTHIDAKEAEALYRRGVQIAQKIGDKEKLLDLYTLIEWNRIEVQGAGFFGPDYEKAIALASEVKNPYALSLGYYMLGSTHQFLGNFPEASELLQRAIELAEKYGAGWTIPMCYGDFGRLYSQVNEMDKALDAHEKGWRAALKIRHLFAVNWNYQRLLQLYQRRGKTGKILGMIEDFLNMMDKAMAKEETEEDSPFVSFLENLKEAYTAIASSDELRAQCQQRLEEGLERASNRMEVVWYLYQLMDFHFSCEKPEDAAPYAFRLVGMNPQIGQRMLKPLLVIGDIESANELFLGTLQSVSQSWYNLASALRSAEMLYRRFGHQDAFRQICQQFKSEHSEALQKLGLTQLCLEPAQPSGDYSELENVDTFDGDSFSPAWEWIDPKGDCTYAMLSPSGLQITVPPGHDLWPGSNRNAPRLLQTISGDFAIETKISDGKDGRKSGGLLVWKDEDNYIRFEMSPSSIWEGEAHLEFNQAGKWAFAGRGQLEAETLTLRLERQGHRFSAYCSVDGKNWLTCGWVDLPMDEPIQVGIHALCSLQPTTSTRFEYFKILRRRLG